ncbi:hypothetical protein [Actinomadura hibisca]|uniref:hypothetical protein n=1 Tax=Actinomadura hibisca TaxID=68565 RepID=UPI000834D1BB|nr:hypothetical protein [Actinomadura hibisca]
MRVKILATVAAAAAALTACGGAAQPGAAALIGDDRISVSSLNTAVTDWEKEFRADPVANQMRDGAGPEQGDQSESDVRNALAALVNFRIADEAAKDAGVSVTGGQTDQVMSVLNQQGGAPSHTLASGLPKRYTQDFARYLATRELILRRLGAGDAPADAQPDAQATAQVRERWNTLLVRTATRMKIKINPRYGSFDPNQVEIAPVKYHLSNTESGIR